MDDISSLLSSVLENPELTEKLKEVAGSVLGGEPEQPKKESAPPINSDLISVVSKFAPILSAINEEDNNTRLLNALKPFLEDERQKKIDEAIKIMHILHILPMLKKEKIL